MRVAARSRGVGYHVFQENNVRSNKFIVGQTVRFTSGTVGRPGAGGNYKIVKILPLEGDEHQYRIKSAHEPHERIARESQLDRGP